jgi:hypothetical protein
MQSFRAAQPVLVIAAAAAAAVALEADILMSVKVPDEIAPPGGMAQMKVRITEPKPISTGDAFLSFSAFASIDGIAMAGPDSDAAGVARVVGTDVALTFVSPSGSLVTDGDYPLVTVTGRVPDSFSVPLPAKFPFLLSADTIRLFDPSGAAYLVDVQPGSLVVGPGISITDVVPGGADVPAGGVVSIYGMNFRPDTEVRFKEVVLAQVRYIDSTRIDVVLAQRARMHGMRIRVENADGSQLVYFSYQRTTEATPSAHPLLRHAVPLFPSGQVQQAIVEFPSDSGRLASGIALENVGRDQANVILDMTNGGGGGASAVVVIPAKQRLVRDASELFGFPCNTSCAVTVRSTDPIGVIGIVVDQAGTLRPVLPQ